MSKQTLFIGSASESLHVVDVLTEALGSSANVRPWNSTLALESGNLTIQSLVNQREHVDFGCFILDKQDVLISKGEICYSPRDNVVFEIGLFIGLLGLKRTLIIYPSGNMPKIPNDLDGLTLLSIPEEVWDKNCKTSIDLVSSTVATIKRKIKILGSNQVELPELIEQLEELRVHPETAETEQIVVDRFPSSVLSYVRSASSTYNKYPINLLRDVCLYIDSPFEIQDVHELSHVQGSLEGEAEVWVFAMKMLDIIDPMYTTAKNNINKGLKYVYFQHDTKNFDRLLVKLTKEIGGIDSWKGAAICIIVPKEILMPCDYLIYDPNLEKQKGYVGKSTNSKDHLLIELNDNNVEYTINTWESFVYNCWEEHESDQVSIFRFKEPETKEGL